MAPVSPVPLGSVYNVRTRSGEAEQSVIVPDNMFNPEVQIYFDFLRMTTVSPFEREVQFDEEGNPLPEPPATVRAFISGREREFTQRQRERLMVSLMDAVIENILYFVATFGLNLGLGGTNIKLQRKKESSPEDKQNFINLFLNQILSDVSTNRSRTGPGTASITFRPLRLAQETNIKFADLNMLFNSEIEDKFNQLLSPDVWVYIFGRGRLYPQYIYPMFSGFTTSVAYENSNGFDSITVNCDDPTKLLRLTWYTFRAGASDPTLLQSLVDSQNYIVGMHPFAGIPAEEIIRLLVTGNKEIKSIKQGDEERPPPQIYGVLDYEFEPNIQNIINTEAGKVITDFSQLYGNGTTLGSAIYNMRKNNKLITWGNTVQVNPYIEYLGGMPEAFQSTHNRRIDTISEVAQRTYSEFYADAAGNFHFHPMRVSPWFLNGFISVGYKDIRELIGETKVRKDGQDPTRIRQLTALSGGEELRFVTGGVLFVGEKAELVPGTRNVVRVVAPYLFINSISQEEITTSSYSLSDAELTTFVGLRGQQPYSNSPSAILTGATYVGSFPSASSVKSRYSVEDETYGRFVWYLRRYGYRRRDILNPLYNIELADENLRTKYAEAQYRMMNKDVLSATVSTIFRPEMEIARPAFLPHRKELYYIDSVSHSYSVGQLCSTTVGLTFGRTDNEGYSDFVDYLIQDYARFEKLSMGGSAVQHPRNSPPKQPGPGQPPSKEGTGSGEITSVSDLPFAGNGLDAKIVSPDAGTAAQNVLKKAHVPFLKSRATVTAAVPKGGTSSIIGSTRYLMEFLERVGKDWYKQEGENTLILTSLVRHKDHPAHKGSSYTSPHILGRGVDFGTDAGRITKVRLSTGEDRAVLNINMTVVCPTKSESPGDVVDLGGGKLLGLSSDDASKIVNKKVAKVYRFQKFLWDNRSKGSYHIRQIIGPFTQFNFSSTTAGSQHCAITNVGVIKGHSDHIHITVGP